MDDLFLIQYANLLDGSDFNSNYIQATGEMRITMLQDLERLTAINKIRAKYDRKAELVQQYGTKWRAHIPKSYSMFNPLAERFIFTAHSLTENVLSAAIKNSAEALGLSDNTVDALLSKISEPFGTQLMVLPDPLTKTLKKLTAPTQRGFFGRAFKSITTAWKQFALYAIPRAVKFNFRNLTGDFDSNLEGKLSNLRQAIKRMHPLSGLSRKKMSS